MHGPDGSLHGDTVVLPTRLSLTTNVRLVGLNTQTPAIVATDSGDAGDAGAGDGVAIDSLLAAKVFWATILGGKYKFAMTSLKRTNVVWNLGLYGRTFSLPLFPALTPY